MSRTPVRPGSAHARVLRFMMPIAVPLLVACSITFASTPGNPIFRVSPSGWDSTSVRDPEVLRPGSCLLMWYRGYQVDRTFGQIGVAYSCDGETWNRSLANPVIVQDQPWKSSSIGGMSVIQDFVPGFRYRMWYEGRSAEGDSSIGYATSTNGFDWTDHPDNPIIAHGPDSSFTRSIGSPTVIIDRGFRGRPTGSLYKMWFSGSNLDFGGTSAGIGLATSDDGINWTLPEAPLPGLSGPEFRDPDVLRLDDQRGLNFRGFCADPIFSANHEVGGNPCEFYPFRDNDPNRPGIALVGKAVVRDMNKQTRLLAATLDPYHNVLRQGDRHSSRDIHRWHGLDRSPAGPVS